MRPLPLKWRISLLVIIVIVVVITTISVVAYYELRDSLLSNIDRTLQAMAGGILADLGKFHDVRELRNEVRSLMKGTENKETARYRVWLEGKAVDLIAGVSLTGKYGSWLRELPASDRPELGGQLFFNIGWEGEEYRAIWVRRPTPQGNVNIVIAYPSHHTYHEMGEFLRLLLILGGSIVVGSTIAAILIVHWGLQPIAHSAAKMRTITHRNIAGVNPASVKVPAELRPFAEALGEMLARLNEAMQRQKHFTADASHELRTPLALAKSTLQATRTRDRSKSEYKRAIDETLDDVARMEHLIGQLLSLARMDETDKPRNFTNVSLDVLLRDLAETFDARAAHSGGKVLCPDLPATTLRGNDTELVQLFGNLLDNAIAHGPAGGTVRISLIHAKSGMAKVCVHDDGGNIPPDALIHLFDRFYRADSSRAHATGGTGLGLAIARRIARRHGGDIEITSDPAAGTDVIVWLPLVRL